MDALPVCTADIYSNAEILEPYDTYAKLRELGPVVKLPAMNNVLRGLAALPITVTART